MAVDVCHKIISANAFKDGSVVVTCNKLGSYDSIDGVLNNTSDTLLYNKYDTRFDDPRYYEGDTAS